MLKHGLIYKKYLVIIVKMKKQKGSVMFELSIAIVWSIWLITEAWKEVIKLKYGKNTECQTTIS